VKTIVVGEPPVEITAFLARRRALGQDRFDEVWEGEYHVVPAPHPWHGYVDKTLGELLGPWARAAGLIGTGRFNLGVQDDYRVPDGGYHHDLPSRSSGPDDPLVRPGGATYEEAAGSNLLGISAADLAGRIDWPG